MGKILHAVFNYSAAGSVRQAIEAAARDDEVVATGDDLSMGPINPPEIDARVEWLRHIWGLEEPGDEYDDVRFHVQRDDLAWTRILNHEGLLVVWMSRRSSSEYCGFMELLRRVGEKPFNIVDISEYQVKGRYIFTTGMLNPNEFFRDELFGRMAMLSEEDRIRYNAEWRRLQSENAPLRAQENGRIVSAPIDYLDRRILSLVGTEWTKGARIVGNILGEDWDRCQAEKGDGFYWSRLLHLVKQREVEARGDLSTMRTTELRLPEV